MPTLIVVDRKGHEKTIAGDAGLSVMEVIRDNGFDELLALCGGCCSCATCHVYVDEAWAARLPEPTAEERDMVEGLDNCRPNSRLGCQVTVTDALDGLVVTVAEEV